MTTPPSPLATPPPPSASRQILTHSRHLEPALRHFSRVFPRFDLDAGTPGNGYRSLALAARRLVAHSARRCRALESARRQSAGKAALSRHAAELEACAAGLAQVRALLCLARRLLRGSAPGELFPREGGGGGGEGEDDVSELVLREFSTMRNGCFYGRCLGFQFTPALRPFLQTITIGLVSFGENYSKEDPGLGVSASSLFTTGKFALDPELRGAEFERQTQHLGISFWKRFWSLTENELLASLASMAADPVDVCRLLSVPPEPLELPLASNPQLSVTIPPPVAHSGPAPIRMRLLSHRLRQGQDSAALRGVAKGGGGVASRALPPSPSLLVHFHGGGFVAQTSRSHELYLRAWARDVRAPVLAVDYALAPESPFPRALEECFYAYCWAMRHCRLLGSTASRVCLSGDSAGGNLVLAVALRAAAVGVRAPAGLVAAYPVTLVRAAASPSRLLTLLDPLLPLGVLCRCLAAYAGSEPGSDPEPAPPPRKSLLQQIRQGLTWLRGGSKGAPKQEEPEPQEDEEDEEGEGPDDVTDDVTAEGEEPYPDRFRPLRPRGPSPPPLFRVPPSPIARSPLVSPLLAPDEQLRALPPLHLVACALDPLLDDSVALARRMRALGAHVTLRVLPDLPHGFLSLAPLSAGSARAAGLCARLIRLPLTPPPSSSPAPP
ncbi:hormone-sensitive lipase, partial [Melopsittacus undulatus]|uniref:hormone-sensitive lipase n=1 Tax=Melopsittacus undulatus TaxID=13146 RepID=UPI00146CA87F